MKLEILQTCPPVIRDFLTYNETIKGKSSLSVNEYFLDLQNFFRYLLTVRGLVDKTTPPHVHAKPLPCAFSLNICASTPTN